jgi:hypothetical protein
MPAISLENGLKGDGFRSVIMTYRVFHTDSVKIVDFKMEFLKRKKMWLDRFKVIA